MRLINKERKENKKERSSHNNRKKKKGKNESISSHVLPISPVCSFQEKSSGRTLPPTPARFVSKK